MNFIFRTFIPLLLSISLASYSLQQIHQLSISDEQISKTKEVLYLPDGSALDILSFGYKNALANVLWFKTISYFGKHYKTDRNYEWLSHMCSLITDLNPHAEHVYSFCGTMLSWEVEDASAAYDIFSKAIESSPDYWRYYYLRGFISFYFLNDSESAKKDFIHSSKLPDAPAFVARLAASKMSLSDPEQAVTFLKQILETTEDPNQRASLEDKLKEAECKLLYRDLEVASSKFQKEKKSTPTSIGELIREGFLSNSRRYLADPFGERFYFDESDKKLKTSSWKKCT